MEPIGAEFVSIQCDDKKTVLKFNIKRDAKGNVIQLYPHAAVTLLYCFNLLKCRLMSFMKRCMKIEYSVDGEGNVSVPEGQISFDDKEPEHKLQRVK